jgi:hypothetical protein
VRFLQRFIARLRLVWATLTGIDPDTVAPLSDPLFDPNVRESDLCDAARRAGTADGRGALYDTWFFGAPDDEVSDRFDPQYVRELRQRREAAIGALRSRQDATFRRLSRLRQRRDDADRQMADTRAMMAGLTTRRQTIGERPIPDPIPPIDQQAAANDQQHGLWEGETKPLATGWRLLILGLVTATIELYIIRYILRVDGDGLQTWMAVCTSLVMVIGPFVSGMLLRDRQATGSDPRVGWVILAVSCTWLVVVAIVGWIRATILEHDASAGLHIVSTTVIIMFVALLILVGAMALMLGLARRHPYQDAYTSQRRMRDLSDAMMGRTIAQINPEYRDGDPNDPQTLATAEAEIRAAYCAAEEAYFTALVEARHDQAFTEAVVHRRGLRPGAQAATPV